MQKKVVAFATKIMNLLEVKRTEGQQRWEQQQEMDNRKTRSQIHMTYPSNEDPWKALFLHERLCQTLKPPLGQSQQALFPAQRQDCFHKCSITFAPPSLCPNTCTHNIHNICSQSAEPTPQKNNPPPVKKVNTANGKSRGNYPLIFARLNLLLLQSVSVCALIAANWI